MVVVAVGCLSVAGVVALVTRDASSAIRVPGEFSAEAGFARDMQIHHSQAVDMSVLIRDRSADPTVRAVALDIVTSQQQQIGQMYAWLELWGLPQTGEAAAMSWMMGDAGSHHAGVDETAMAGETAGGYELPGMATEQQLRRLQSTSGRAAERLWLRLMIRHHRAGVDMAYAVLMRTDRPEVERLAQGIVTSQQSEIDQLQQLLEDPQ